MNLFVLLKDQRSWFLNSLLAGLCLTVFINSSNSYADGIDFNHLSNSNFGGVGLIQTPTSRFTNDSGRLSFGISSVEPYNKITASMQLLPWLEGSIVYTEINNRLYNIAGFEKSNTQSYKDKGFNVRFKLLEETLTRPSLAFGFIDIGGTGFFSSDYIVANKKFGNFDFSLGMGWGKMATSSHIKNPFGQISDKFYSRSSSFGSGGDIDIDNFFSGKNASFFGGIQYQTPHPDISLKLEYNPNDFSAEPLSNNIEVDSPINIGMNYKITNNLDLAAGIERGNTFFFNLFLNTDLNVDEGLRTFKLSKENLLTSPWKSFYLIPDEGVSKLAKYIFWQMGNEGITAHNVTFKDKEVIAEVTQGRFRESVRGIDLASRILANNAPQNIETITVVNLDFGIETLRSSIDVSELRKVISNGPLENYLTELPKKTHLRESKKPITVENDQLYPSFSWSLSPNVSSNIGGPDNFYIWKMEAKLATEYALKKGLVLSTIFGINITDNMSKFKYEPTTGTLYRVRSDVKEYWVEGKNGIRRMELDYVFDLSKNLYGSLSIGLFEEMFGGVGGELLYHDSDKRWAIGIEAYRVRQRDFSQDFSFKAYEVSTGHVNLIFDFPKNNVRLKTSYGKYLAGDTGFTVDLSRRFENGTHVGAVAAFTDATAEQYGEGGFSKWVYVSLPMDLFSVGTTRNYSTAAWSPLTRDGGQKLATNIDLFGIKKNAVDNLSLKNEKRKYFSFKRILDGFATKPIISK